MKSPSRCRRASRHAVVDPLDAEEAHADRLAEVLRWVVAWLPKDESHMHVIAVTGTQITVGQIVEGTLAVHKARREGRPK